MMKLKYILSLIAFISFVNIIMAAPHTCNIKVNGVSFEMIQVKGGTFYMGATSEQEEHAKPDEKPAHKVTVSDFYIGKYEVTQELWQAIMGCNPSFNRNPDFPVEQVSWDDCMEFIRILNTFSGLKFRLLSEAEWEYAAKGGEKNLKYKYSGGDDIDKICWYESNSSGKTHYKGTKKCNSLWIFDMSGNVMEWCNDWFGKYPIYSEENPKGPDSGIAKTVRGGSWNNFAKHCRNSYRCCWNPNARYNFLGLRLAIDAL